MPIESATYIHQLNASYPQGDDPRAEGDDHMRMFKAAVKATFPNIAGPVTRTHAQLNKAPYDKASAAEMLGAQPILVNENGGVPGGANSPISLAWHTATGRIRFNVDGLTPAGGFVLDSEFTGGNQRKAIQGYQIFPGGFRIAWGSSVAITPEANVPYLFSIPLAQAGIFFNQVVWAACIPGSGNGGGHITLTVEGFDPGGIAGYASAATPGNRTMRWFAFGF